VEVGDSVIRFVQARILSYQLQVDKLCKRKLKYLALGFLFQINGFYRRRELDGLLFQMVAESNNATGLHSMFSGISGETHTTHGEMEGSCYCR